MSERRPALFLDRDGILLEVIRRGDVISSARSWEEFRLIAGAAEVVTQARALGFFTVLASNQPDVARGLLGPDLLQEFHDRLLAHIPLDALEVCLEDGLHRRRKPNPGMLLDAAKTWNLDLGRSFFLGDSQKDVLAARAAGVQPVLLRTDYNREASPDCPSLSVIGSLPELLPLLRTKIHMGGRQNEGH